MPLRGLGVMEFGGAQARSRGLVIATGSTTAAAVELFPGFTVGRSWQWSTNPTLSNPDWTITNYDLITDGGQPALRHHTGGEFTEASILTVASDIAHARVELLFRAQPASGLGITNIAMKSRVRDQDANNWWHSSREFAAGGASWLLIAEKYAGSNIGGSAANGDGALNNSDSTNYQRVMTDVVHDAIRTKTWFIADSEPIAIALGTATTTSGSPTVTSATATEGTFQKGQYLTGTGIAAGSRITAVSGSTLTLSVNATASGTVAVRAESFGKSRFRPANGFGGSTTTTADNTTETGTAGLRAMYGGIVQDVKVSELLPL